MTDKSTTTGDQSTAATGMKTGSIVNKRGAVLFNENDLLDLTKKSVNVLGINYDTLDGAAKEGFVGQTIGALTGVPAQEIEKQYGKTEPGVAIEFRKLVLQEAKNSPNWDQDEFIAGYKYDGPIGKSTGTVEHEELQHSSMR
jgi:hypothetical protein